MRIGVVLEGFNLPLAPALAKARQLGIAGVQLYTGRYFPMMATTAQLNEVKKQVEAEGLAVSAVCGTFAGETFYTGSEKDLDAVKWSLEAALALGTNIVTTHIGVIPDDKKHPLYAPMLEICGKMAQHAHGLGGHFAIETGPEKAAVLKGFLDDIACDGMAVNLDPANFVMCSGDDPVAAVQLLAGHIVHTHAKDGVMVYPCDCRAVFAPGPFGLEPAPADGFRAVRLGQGGVDWPAYLAALRAAGFDGWQTIEYEGENDPTGDIAAAVEFLKGQGV